jgi:hypothetical protein
VPLTLNRGQHDRLHEGGQMKKHVNDKEEKYEIIIKRRGSKDPVEIDIMGDSETREILRLIGLLNMRSAFAS